MKTLALIAATFVAMTAPAAHADGPRCDNARLKKTLALMLGGDALVVGEQGDATTVSQRKGGEVVVRVTCDDIAIPLAGRVERPSKGPARTWSEGPLTVSVTSRGAVSLEIAAGALHKDRVALLVLDDQSVSLTRGEAVLYAFATRPDGTTVETEGRGVGCGCVKTTTAEGVRTTRPL